MTAMGRKIIFQHIFQIILKVHASVIMGLVQLTLLVPTRKIGAFSEDEYKCKQVDPLVTQTRVICSGMTR